MLQKVSIGSLWEDVVGYSRAIRIGNLVEVAGTTAMDEEMLIGKDDVYEQTIFRVKKIEKALLEVGATLKNVIRTRMYVTNIDDWEKVGKADAHYFNTIKPKTILVFNKECDRELWNNCNKPSFIYFDLVDNDYKKSFQASFKKADKEDVALLLKLPNFDYVVFEEISGISKKMIIQKVQKK